MASSSQTAPALLPLSSTRVRQWKYDVFLSFRGPDTRKSFTFELYDRLQNKRGINTFMDEENLEKGEEIPPTLLTAIEDSRFSIVILSKDYASSTWCLEELRIICECMKDEKRIIPVFYQVDPTDVRFQKNSFKEAFTKHENSGRHVLEKVQQWRDALNRVSNFSGWNTQAYKTDRQLLEDIVKHVSNRIPPIEIKMGDYEKIISRSFSPLTFSSNEELYKHLCEHHILLDEGNLSFSIDKLNGKKCWMLGARSLNIDHQENPKKWNWKSLPESRFSEVAELIRVYWLEITVTIETKTLSPQTTYAAYLVYQLPEGSSGFANLPYRKPVKLCLKEVAAERSVFLDHPTKIHPEARSRGDGWMEIEMGEFFNEGGSNDTVQCCVEEHDTSVKKSGLIVEGIELRPKKI